MVARQVSFGLFVREPRPLASAIVPSLGLNLYQDGTDNAGSSTFQQFSFLRLKFDFRYCPSVLGFFQIQQLLTDGRRLILAIVRDRFMRWINRVLATKVAETLTAFKTRTFPDARLVRVWIVFIDEFECNREGCPVPEDADRVFFGGYRDGNLALPFGKSIRVFDNPSLELAHAAKYSRMVFPREHICSGRDLDDTGILTAGYQERSGCDKREKSHARLGVHHANGGSRNLRFRSV